MHKIAVSSSSGNYTVLCGRGLVGQAARLTSKLGPARIFFVSSPRVWRHCGRQVAAGFPRDRSHLPILFDDRESAKNLRTLELLCRRLVQAGADRESLLVAVGGGVVGDVTGFAAACYLRGVRLIHVPTTVVAQADSAIGGKTGVNLPEGKNLVGAFYPPRLVVADPDLLRSLPQRQYRSGLYEIIKYGVIADAKLFTFLEGRCDALLSREPAALDWVLPRCIRVKAKVVSRDERESGLREILNFGHTLGHALEAATAYKRFLHGEAVAWGLLVATQIAVEMKLLDPAEAARIAHLVRRIGPLPGVGNVTPRFLHRLFDAMRADKKTRQGRLRWVLPRRIGQVEVVSDVPESLVRKAIALSLANHSPGVRRMNAP